MVVVAPSLFDVGQRGSCIFVLDGYFTVHESSWRLSPHGGFLRVDSSGQAYLYGYLRQVEQLKKDDSYPDDLIAAGTNLRFAARKGSKVLCSKDSPPGFDPVSERELGLEAGTGSCSSS